jgi:hypothetical protein
MSTVINTHDSVTPNYNTTHQYKVKVVILIIKIQKLKKHSRLGAVGLLMQAEITG